MAITGHAMCHLGDVVDGSRRLLQEATQSNPNDPMAWLYSSVWSTMWGNGRDSIDEAETALRLSPLDPQRYYFELILSTCLAATGDWARAVELARSSLRKNGYHAPTLRALLVAVEGLDRGVHVEDPRQVQHRGDGIADLPAQPCEPLLFVDAFHGGAHGILTDRALHAEEPRIDAVAAHAVDVGVAPVTVEDAQEHGAHDVAGAAAAIAGVVQRTVAHELIPPSASVQKLEEEDQLAFARDGSLRIPLGKKPSAGSVQRP